ncbi:MAG TPA: PIN domain-containing protein [Terriglobia bacterium]|nr:PIN domain-containing protein [Terriglobia bacterium]
MKIRQQHRLKLPDAIVVATAIEPSAILVTEDQRIQNVPGLISIGLN